MEQHCYFSFEKLDVYRVAREALLLGVDARAKLRGLPGDFSSQFERALLSVVINIAEGAGRESLADQRRHYVIARGSANEAGAAVEIAALYGALSTVEHEALRSRLVRTVKMLNAMVRR